MSKLMQATQVIVRAEGSTVVMQIGNSTMTMGYEDALTIARFLRVRGKEAKRNAGDNTRHWGVVGTLETLESLREKEKQFWS